MTDHIAGRAKYPVKGTGSPVGLGLTTVTFGNTSISSQSTNCGVVLTRTGVGTYTVVLPVGRDAALFAQIKSPLLTVDSVVVTAQSTSAGTATIKATLAGVAADPAIGDVIKLLYLGEC